MPPEDLTRTSDAERDRVVCVLSDHFALGRLTLEELDGRTERALQARTRAQLETLLADLPTGPTPTRARLDRRGVGRPRVSPSGRRWQAWASTAVICLGIWLAIAVSQGAVTYFWPFWVIVPWGAALAVGSVGARPLP